MKQRWRYESSVASISMDQERELQHSCSLHVAAELVLEFQIAKKKKIRVRRTNGPAKCIWKKKITDHSIINGLKPPKYELKIAVSTTDDNHNECTGFC